MRCGRSIAHTNPGCSVLCATWKGPRKTSAGFAYLVSTRNFGVARRQGVTTSKLDVRSSCQLLDVTSDSYGRPCTGCIGCTYAFEIPARNPGRARVLVIALAAKVSSPVSKMRSFEARKRRMRPVQCLIKSRKDVWVVELTDQHRISLRRLSKGGTSKRSTRLG